MNEIFDAIKNRRSVRVFTDKEIPLEALQKITEAAIYAPSARNRQSWQFTVVRGREKIDRLAFAVGKALGNPEYDFYKPAAIIICSNDPEATRWGADDCACAMQNMFLASYALGIGSVWINQLRDVYTDPEVSAILTEYQVPENHIPMGTCALGYAGTNATRPFIKKYDRIKWN